MIRDADQNRVHQPAFTGRRKPIVMQKEDQIRERGLPHQVEDVVSAHSDVIRTGVDDRGTPRIHSVVGCYVRRGNGR